VKSINQGGLATVGRNDPNDGGLIIAKARGSKVRPYLLRTVSCGVFFHRRRRRCGLITRKSGSQSGRCDDYEQREGRQDFHLLRLGCVQVKTAHPACRSQGRANKGSPGWLRQRRSSTLGSGISRSSVDQRSGCSFGSGYFFRLGVGCVYDRRATLSASWHSPAHPGIAEPPEETIWVAAPWRLAKEKPPRRAAYPANTDKSVSGLGCGDRI
jgi:hypothetical protein